MTITMSNYARKQNTRSVKMKLRTDHPESSYGVPMLVDDNDKAYGGNDTLPDGTSVRHYVITGMKRGKYDVYDVKRFLSHESLQQFNVRIPKWLHEAISDIADVQGKKIQSVNEDALTEYVKNFIKRI